MKKLEMGGMQILYLPEIVLFQFWSYIFLSVHGNEWNLEHLLSHEAQSSLYSWNCCHRLRFESQEISTWVVGILKRLLCDGRLHKRLSETDVKTYFTIKFINIIQHLLSFFIEGENIWEEISIQPQRGTSEN